MSTKTCLSVAAALLLAGPSISEPAPAKHRVDSSSPRPVRVVVIIADDVGVDQVGVYERAYPPLVNTAVPHPTPCTPVLDQLAAEGVRFTNAWANPVCSPTRAQILTGRRAHHTGIGTITDPPEAEAVGLGAQSFSMARLLEYDVFLGKWHLAEVNQRPSHPLDLGFREFRGTFFNLKADPGDGPSFYEWRQWDGLSPTPVPQTRYATAVTTDDAIEYLAWLETNAGGDPWLLVVSYHAAHVPFHCPEVPDCPGPATCEQDWCYECDLASSPYPTPVRRTRAMVRSLDAEIGRLLERVDRSNTAVIFIGDNGTTKEASFPPWREEHAKGTLHQGGINVPLIIQTPYGKEGEVCHELVSATDLFATVAQLVDRTAAVPANVDSTSVARHVDATYPPFPPGSSRAFVYSERFLPCFTPEPDGPPPLEYRAQYHRRALRNATHKLIERRELDGTTQHFYRLYDVSLAQPPPQDPAVLNQGWDPWADAYERFDLLALDPTQRSWTPEDIHAFEVLAAELARDYPALPIGEWEEFAAEIVRTATRVAVPSEGTPNAGASCSDLLVFVGRPREDGAEVMKRAFLQFDVSSIPPERVIERIELDVPVYTGAVDDALRVEVGPLLGEVSDFDDQSAAGCAALFDSIATPAYAVTDRWGGEDPWTKTVVLNEAAVADLQARIGLGLPSTTFSVGLRLEDETGDGPRGIRLRRLEQGPFPLSEAYRLRVLHGPPR